MFKASSETGLVLVTDMANPVVNEGVVPVDWEVSSIVNSYKGNGYALERGNYRGLKVLEHVRKAIERIVWRLVGEKENIANMQLGSMPKCETTEAILLVRREVLVELGYHGM